MITWCNAYLNTSTLTDLKNAHKSSSPGNDLITVIWVIVICYFHPIILHTVTENHLACR